MAGEESEPVTGRRRHVVKNVVMVLALVGAGFALAWLRFRPHLEHDGAFTDGRARFELAEVERLRYAVWDAPELLAGEVNGPGRETRTTVSPDGRWVVFASGERGVDAELYVGAIAQEGDGARVTEVRPLFEVNGPFDEVAPRFGEQGLYFASNRPGGEGGLDLFRAPFVTGAFGEARFGEPQRLAGGLNGPADDTDPAPVPRTSAGGREHLVFASNRGAKPNARGERVHDLYRAEPARDGSGAETWSVTALDELNSPQDEREPAFGPDGSSILFASDRGAGPRPERDDDFDLYRSALLFGERAAFGTWAAPEPLAALNTDAHERAPDPSADGFALRFARDLGSGAGEEILRATSRELFRTPGDPVGWEELVLVLMLLLLALLAWAAKHWRAMDVLYRCFVVSLIAHLLLMWWLQEVHPEAEVDELVRHGPRVRVQLTDPSADVARRTAAGGELEAVREASASESGSAPTRAAAASQVLADADTSAAPGAASFERAAAPSVTTAADAAFASDATRETPSATRTGEVARFEAGAELDAARRAAVSDDLALPNAPSDASSATRAPREFAADGPARSGTDTSAFAAPDASSSLASNNAAATARPAARDGALDASADLPSLDASRQRAEAPSLAAAVETRAVDSDGPVRSIDANGATSDDLASALAPTGSFERADSAMDAPRRASARSAPGTSPAPTDLASASTPGALEFAPQRFERAAVGTAVLDAPLAPAAASAPRREVALASTPSQGSAPAAASTAPQFDLTGAASPASFERARPSAASTAPTFERTTAPRTDLGPARPSALDLTAAAPPAPAPVPEPDLASWEATPYRSRTGAAKAEALRTFGGDEETEAAVRDGLRYLASIQNGNGSWGSTRDAHDKYGDVRIGKTGLCLLAFLGAGHTPASRTEHSAVVERGLAFLVAQQQPNGHLGRCASYGHGIGTYALAEAFALTPDAGWRDPLERAVQHVLAMQVTRARDGGGDRRSIGGWGYYTDDGGFYSDHPRTSITAWQVMALESARLGGVEVPDAAFERARRYLEGTWDDEFRAFRYTHDPSFLDNYWPTLPGSSPAAMFGLSLLGRDLTTPDFAVARESLMERAPRDFRVPSDDAFIERAHGNLYFVYYGSLAAFRIGGDLWEEWNAALKGMLLGAQNDDGSWTPISTYARDHAGDDRRDASYTTALAVLSLEVYYRYFTPLLDVGLKSGGAEPAPSAVGTGR